MSWSEIPVALVAGFLSFLAPCVLPLVPGYLSTVSAVSAEDLGRPGTARRVVTSSIPFVLGFTAFFVLLGVGASLLGGSLFRDQFLLEEVAGFVLVVFGLAFMGLLPWPERLVGAGLVQGARSRGSRVLLGGAFAVCAAPCIGPVLAAILVLAGSSDTALEGAGFRIDHSEASLYLWATRDEDCWATVAALADLGILVAPGIFYGRAGGSHVRVALTTTDERAAAVAARL